MVNNFSIEKLEFYRQIAIKTGNVLSYIEKELSDYNRLSEHIYNTSKIEGNTITRDDIHSLLVKINPLHEIRDKYEAKELLEVEGMLSASRLLYENLDKVILTEDFILDLHESVYNPVADITRGIYGGEYRRYGSYTYRKDGTKKEYLDERYIEDYIQDMIFYYNNSKPKTLEDICLLKLEFIHIHPFGDGNGRVSRLLLNWALATNGYPPIIIKWEEKREYINTLNSFENGRDPAEFTEFVGKKLIEIYKDMTKASENEIVEF